MSIPTRVYFRDLLARTPEQIQGAHGALAAREMNFRDVSPQQRAWLMGARSALAWVLGLPNGGRKVAELLEGIATPGVVSLTVATDFVEKRDG